jgi:hypothetical protein
MENNRPQPPSPPGQPPSKIQQSKPGIVMPGSRPEGAPGAPAPLSPEPRPALKSPDENRPLPVAQPSGPANTGMGKITSFGRERKHEEDWKRTPNTTGTGAIHVKTFHCKLTEDAIAYMDQAVNDWLDAHPQYEVKFVTSTIGTMTGKLKEPALFCQVWV